MRRVSIFVAAVATLASTQCLVTAQAPTVTTTSTAIFEYRLAASGSTTQGRLEVRLANSTDAWGTVCSRGQLKPFGAVEADVACRSLGFLDTTAYHRLVKFSEQGSWTQPITFDELLCIGNETRLDQCSRAASTNCDHYEDIYLGCGVPVAPTPAPPPIVTGVPAPAGTVFEYRLANGTSNSSGRVEVRPVNTTGAWGTVCKDFFTSVDAGVACKSAGFPGGHESFRTVNFREIVSSAQPIYMDDLGCLGNETRLDECPRASSSNCGHAEDIYVTCSVTTSAPPATMTTFATTTGAAVAATSAPAASLTPTPPPAAVAAITARVRISGTAFAGFLTGSAAVRSQLAAAAASDLGRLLGVDAAYVVITNMTLGSLIVDFSVSSGAGVQPGTLSSRLATATTATWLTATQSVYASASSETLTVSEPPTVSAMAASGAVTPAPGATSAAAGPSSASDAPCRYHAGTVAIAAVLVALAGLSAA